MSELGLTSYITALIRLFKMQAQSSLERMYDKTKTAEKEKKDRTEERQYKFISLLQYKATPKRGLACFAQPPNTASRASRNCLAQPVIYDSVYVCVC